MIIISVTCREGVVPASLAKFCFCDSFNPRRIRVLKITCIDIAAEDLLAIINDDDAISVDITKPEKTKEFFEAEEAHYAAIRAENDKLRAQ